MEARKGPEGKIEGGWITRKERNLIKDKEIEASDRQGKKEKGRVLMKKASFRRKTTKESVRGREIEL